MQHLTMETANPPLMPARPNVIVTPNGTIRNDPYAWLRDDDGKNSEVLDYLKAENSYGKIILEGNSKLQTDILYDMDSRVPRKETKPARPSASLSFWYGSTRGPRDDYWVYNRRPGFIKLQGQRGPLSYGPDLKVTEQVVLDVNKLSKGLKYCDVRAVKPSPDGRYVAFSVDTVGNEEYEIVVQEIGSGQRIAFAGSEERSSVVDFGGMPNCASSLEWNPDSTAVFALLLTPRTHEPYKLVRCKLLPNGGRHEPELLLQDDKSGAVLEMAGITSCSRFLMLFRKAEGYSALLALTLPSGGASAPAAAVQHPSRGVPNGVKLYGNDPWVVVAPESDACDVLRADHLYGNGDGKETFAVLMDTDKYPDGHVCAVTGGDIKRRTVLVPGKRGRQVVDITVCGECGSSMKGAAVANGVGHGSSGTAANDAAVGGRYLIVQMLEDMRADVKVYNLSSIEQSVAARESDRDVRRHMRLAVAAAAAAVVKNSVVPDDNDDDGDDDDDDGDDDDDDEDTEEELEDLKSEQQKRPKPAPSGLLSLLWIFSPGEAISSLQLDHNCWPGTMPYVRVSYSSLTTPTTTVDLDLTAQEYYVREIERVNNFAADRYLSQTLWATSYDGTPIPATVACRTDAWPPTTGRPLPCIVQAYGAYGRRLLPDFIPGDLSILDGGDGSGGGGGAATDGCGPCLMVIAHARGGGELGSYWHVQGKKHKKINTAEDIAAVVQMLVEGGYARPEAVAVWGRSAGGLAMGMTLERCPAGTFRTAVLDVPFLNVLGSMMDTSLPLTIKEQPEWGDPASSQEDYDYILSYSPYDNVESLVNKTPAMMVTCSLNDPRVPYWGPAKFVARLRAAMAEAAAAADAGAGAAAAGGPVLLLTELDAGGHFAASGASGRLAERAMRVAFMLRELKKGLDATAAPLTPVKPARTPEALGAT